MVQNRAKRIALIVAVLAQISIVPAALAAEPSGFSGTWVSIDCAQWSEDGHVDCSVWGDGSDLRLTIATGDTPRATFQDSFASVCADSGAATRWVAAGSGSYDDVFLWLTFTKSGCGSVGQGGYGGVQLYHDPGSDTIWEDEDGDDWGIMWYRQS